MDNKVSQIQNITSLINGHLGTITRQKEELNKVTEMLNGILDNDPAYKEKTDKSKEAIKEKAKVKAQILQQPHAHDLNFKVKESRAEIKQLDSELSNFLSEYQKLTGSNQFEDESGEMHEIVYTAKLVGKTHFNDSEKGQ